MKPNQNQKILRTLVIFLSGIFLFILLAVSAIFIKKSFVSPKEIEISTIQKKGAEDIKADLNGDGKEETLSLIVSGDEQEGYKTSLVAYDFNGKELGKLPDSMPIKVPMTGSGKVYMPIKEDKNQFVSFDFAAGPHSSETMFFGLFELNTGGMGILPVCLTENVHGASDCLFWSGEVGQLAVTDLDGDGSIEVIETVDEYPKDGQVSAEDQKILENTWKDSGQDVVDGALRIMKREQGGKGKKVVWGIYRYNGSYFEEQTGINYNKYFGLAKDYLKSTFPDIIRKDKMSKASLDYNEFIRSFWTH